MIRDGHPSPEQARKMAKIFIIATIVGALFVFLNVTMRSYNLRMQQQELKNQQNSAAPAQPSPEPAAPIAQP